MRNLTVCSFLHVLIASKSRIIRGTRHVEHGGGKTSFYKISLGVPATISKNWASGASVAASPSRRFQGAAK
jgi:hypothetical protein